MSTTLAIGDRVRHRADPNVLGTVDAVDPPLHPALPGLMIGVQWDDGYHFVYGENVLAKIAVPG